MVSSMGIHCHLNICFVPRGGGGDGLLPRSQLCLPRQLIFCRAKEQLDSAFDGSIRGETLAHVIDNFPDLPDTSRPRHTTPRRRWSDARRRATVLQVSVPGPSGTLPPHILYLLELGFDLQQIKFTTGKNPAFADYSLEGKIMPVIEFLLDLGVPKSNLPKILMKFPHLCGKKLPENLSSSLAILETLGVDKGKWPKVIFRYPMFLSLSQKKVEANIEFLHELGLSEEQIGKIVAHCPQIVGLSVNEKLRPSVEYFQSLGVDAARMLQAYPTVMNLSLETNIKPSNEFFLENGFSIEEVAGMINKFGHLYAYSLKGNVVPKWKFFFTIDYYSREDLIKYPHYFGHSLEKRIKPRYSLMKESGVKFVLSQLLRSTDKNFELILKKRIEKMQLEE